MHSHCAIYSSRSAPPHIIQDQIPLANGLCHSISPPFQLPFRDLLICFHHAWRRSGAAYAGNSLRSRRFALFPGRCSATGTPSALSLPPGRRAFYVGRLCPQTARPGSGPLSAFGIRTIVGSGAAPRITFAIPSPDPSPGIHRRAARLPAIYSPPGLPHQFRMPPLFRFAFNPLRHSAFRPPHSAISFIGRTTQLPAARISGRHDYTFRPLAQLPRHAVIARPHQYGRSAFVNIIPQPHRDPGILPPLRSSFASSATA